MDLVWGLRIQWTAKKQTIEYRKVTKTLKIEVRARDGNFVASRANIVGIPSVSTFGNSFSSIPWKLRRKK